MPDVRLLAMHRPLLATGEDADNGGAWAMVDGARACFPGHDQPRSPAAPGRYARTTPAVLEAQAALARAHGIGGFCFQIDAGDTGGIALALIADWLAEAGASALPFCLMWCNAPDARAAAVPRAHAAAPDPEGAAFVARVAALAAHPAYVRVEGSPLVLVEAIESLPSPIAVATNWRSRLHAALGVEPFLLAGHGRWQGDPSLHGFDAAFAWPPVGLHLEPLNSVFGAAAGAVGAINDYRRLVVESTLRTCPPYPVLHTVLARWDDTPLLAGAGQAFVHATPEVFEFWLREAIERTRLRFTPGQRIVFLRAWNDWLHGSYLEPDSRYAAQYLAAIPRAGAGARNAPPTVPIARDEGAHAGAGAPGAERRPRVSVVVPSYNHEEYIESALQSVYAQTFADIELIVVDDGSRDRTLELARALAASAPRPTTVLGQANAGAHAAINRGIAAARGEYIAILNSDDLYEPARIERLVRLLDETGAVLAFSDVVFVDRANKPVDERLPYVRGLRALLEQLAGQPWPELALINVNGAISTGNFVFRRSLVERIGGFRALAAVHDWDFLLAAGAAGRIAFLPERLYRYRFHDTNTFSRTALRSQFEIAVAFQRFFASLDTHVLRADPVAGPRLLAAVRQSGQAGLLPPALRGPRAPEYSDWVLATRPDPARLTAMTAQSRAWPRRPLLSVLLTTYDPPERWLRRALDSVIEQTYDHWECCVADDASTHPEVRAVLAEYAARDPRIRIEFRPVNGHISAATNTALAVARGEFIVLLDHDDELAPDALHWVAAEIIGHPEADLVYTDEDKIDEHGMRFDPHFKSDWDPDLLCAQNCVNHLGAYRTELVRALGGFREGVEGAQDWDLALRIGMADARGRARHIPRVLYHWRAIAGSAAAGSDQKGYVQAAQRRVLTDLVARQGSQARVLPVINNVYWRLQYPLPSPRPAVSIILFGPPMPRDVEAAGARLLRAQHYGPVEVVVAAGTGDALTAAVGRARGAVFCFCDTALEGAGDGWLEELVAQALRPGIGAAGPIVYAPDGTIVEAGWVGAGERAFMPLFAGCRRGHLGPQAHARLSRNLSVVGARAVAVTRARFDGAGGFSPTAPAGWELVDLCLRLDESGLRNVWTPFAELLDRAPDAWTAMMADSLGDGRGAAWLQRWQQRTDDDPAWNPNYALGGAQFSLTLTPRGRAAPDRNTIGALPQRHG